MMWTIPLYAPISAVVTKASLMRMDLDGSMVIVTCDGVYVQGRDLLAIGEVFAVIGNRVGQQARSNVIFEKGGQLPNVGRIQKMSKGTFW